MSRSPLVHSLLLASGLCFACSTESSPNRDPIEQTTDSSGPGAGPGTTQDPDPDPLASGGSAAVETSTGDQGSGGLSSPTGGSTSMDMGSGGSATAQGNYPTPDCPAPVDLGVRIEGRHDGCVEGAVRMAWSGTGFVARFEGTALTFTQEGSAVHYTVVVDGMVLPTLVTAGGTETITAASGLAPGEHVVEVYRQGEASFGPVELLAVDAPDGMMLPPPPARARSIEILGDSISCGYGNEGTSSSCTFSAETENHYLTYGALLARAFQADLSTVAWSGKGVVVNYGGDMGTTLPEMMFRAVPNSDTSVWDFSLRREPDAVIINLGTNDFSTDNDPSEVDFVAGYAEMLENLRQVYPQAFILCTLGPLLSGSDLIAARSGINAAIAERAAAGDDSVVAFDMAAQNPNPGCDWHPSAATHQAMAEELQGVLAANLGW